MGTGRGKGKEREGKDADGDEGRGKRRSSRAQAIATRRLLWPIPRTVSWSRGESARVRDIRRPASPNPRPESESESESEPARSDLASPARARSTIQRRKQRPRPARRLPTDAVTHRAHPPRARRAALGQAHHGRGPQIEPVPDLGLQAKLGVGARPAKESPMSMVARGGRGGGTGRADGRTGGETDRRADGRTEEKGQTSLVVRSLRRPSRRVFCASAAAGWAAVGDAMASAT
ncbi:hypothetical protein BC628DRAFT_1101531 [Trametes gibbosa]|nr:hypothetical protein BC628DRAFT_1101531 [Trametes gibbosa]